ncbi:nucleotidyl transferase AbiEii/AbiGii toxin family protein [Candidatus Saganbacteria bacterium]|nr:nucleotidyl transferase AbiEii/AbiGii toxin family protein [Candidatus Saganbacteria bacterium]
MEQVQLNQLATELKIAPLSLLREEAEMLVLEILSKSDLPKSLIFYGGTALRLAYNCPRFSEDLDFLLTDSISEKALEATLLKVVELEPRLSLEDIKDKRQTLFALLKYRSENLKHPFSIKIEMAKRKNGISKEFRPLASPCSVFQPVLYVADLPSLYKTKQWAIAGRNMARDWFDLWYLAKLLRRPFVVESQFTIAPAEFKREMRRFIPANQWQLIDQVLKDIGKNATR